MNITKYYEKVNNWNLRKDYKKDLDVTKLFLYYCIPKIKKKEIVIIGTGLGADLKAISNFEWDSIIGIEPIEEFFKSSLKIYQKHNGKLFNLTLKEFSQNKKKLSGIFFFNHSINHIKLGELKIFKNKIKNSFIIINNPNAKFEERFWKTDKTMVSNLNGDNIAKILNCEKIFDFYYNSVKIKDEEILVRNAVLLKTKE